MRALASATNSSGPRCICTARRARRPTLRAPSPTHTSTISSPIGQLPIGMAKASRQCCWHLSSSRAARPARRTSRATTGSVASRAGSTPTSPLVGHAPASSGRRAQANGARHQCTRYIPRDYLTPQCRFDSLHCPRLRQAAGRYDRQDPPRSRRGLQAARLLASRLSHRQEPDRPGLRHRHCAALAAQDQELEGGRGADLELLAIEAHRISGGQQSGQRSACALRRPRRRSTL